MNENLNLVDILKDCPRGTKLYSTIHGEVEFISIKFDEDCPIKYKVKDANANYKHVASVSIDGRYFSSYKGECTLFPDKDQRDWSKFKVVPELVDGEIYYCSLFNKHNAIYIHRKTTRYKTEYYVKLDLCDLGLLRNGIIITNEENIKELRKATEEEKQQLLNIIKRDGYKWDEEKKTLEKIDVPHTHEKFYIRIGGIPIEEKSKVYRGDAVVGYENGVSVYDCIETDGLYRIVMPFPLKEGQGMTYECLIQEITQCRYEIENPRNVYLVSGIEVGKGHDNEPLIKDVKILKDLTEQFNPKPDNTEEPKTLEEVTVPKFKVEDFETILKPFDKVLSRDWNDSIWRCNIYEHFKEGQCYPFITMNGVCNQCVPYNDETKHLVGTTEMPPKKYITWEE
jgi:hypothetical protein